MKPFRSGLVCGCLFYLGAIVVAAAWLLNRHAVFDGLIAVPVGGAESLAVRPSGGGARLFTPHRALTPELLSFDTPAVSRRVFNADTPLDGIFLGFPLRVRRAEVLERRPDLELIEERGPGGRLTAHPVRPGATLATADGPVTVESVGPWAGLINDPGGRRMAAMSWRESPTSEWVQGIFVEAGSWITLPPLAAFRLDWVPDEDTARGGLPAARPGLESARWGVRDLRRVHWFENFLPGTGCTVTSGAEYVLLETPANGLEPPPMLRVGIRSGDARRVVRVTANPPEPVEGLLFEYPAASMVCVMLRAWQEDSVWAVAWQGGDAVPPHRWRAGEELALPGGQTLRLDGVTAAGLPVGTQGKPVLMAQAKAGDTTLRLREGLFLRHGDGALRYRRLPQPPLMRYTLEGRGGKTMELGPGDAVRIGPWTFTQSPDNPLAEEAALLHARRAWGDPFQKTGAVLVLLGAVGWILARLFRPERVKDPLPQEGGEGPSFPEA
ncbi:MAG: hypothetical protein GX580_14655 [Candidatus Hydrogenedens sp.]|nr:hypothetical protein [Candidatus Hydrogenedens sp.]